LQREEKFDYVKKKSYLCTVKLIFKHIVTTFVLVCFLTATNGLSLVEHYCSSQNKSFIFWLNQNPDCRTAPCSKVDKGLCCADEKTSDCCKNINRYVKLAVDYFSSQNDTDLDCPIVECRRGCSYCGTFFVALSTSKIYNFPEDFGLPEQLLIKQTTELLL